MLGNKYLISCYIVRLVTENTVEIIYEKVTSHCRVAG